MKEKRTDGRPRPPRQEFERKFLVRTGLLPALANSRQIVQGYLHESPPYDRVRIIDGRRAVLEYKGRDDFESSSLPLPLDEAEYLIRAHAVGCIVKSRSNLAAGGGLYWEVDVYEDDNRPLVIAEIELPTKNAALPKNLPNWLGLEVTGDARFKNRVLATRPFSHWSKREKDRIIRLMGQ